MTGPSHAAPATMRAQAGRVLAEAVDRHCGVSQARRFKLARVARHARQAEQAGFAEQQPAHVVGTAPLLPVHHPRVQLRQHIEQRRVMRGRAAVLPVDTVDLARKHWRGRDGVAPEQRELDRRRASVERQQVSGHSRTAS